MHRSSRFSACRRELNSHDAAEPQDLCGTPHRATPGISAERELTEHRCKVTGRGGATESAKVPPCQIELSHCVASPVNQSVCVAAAANTATICLSQLRRRLQDAARHGRQRGAGSA